MFGDKESFADIGRFKFGTGLPRLGTEFEIVKLGALVIVGGGGLMSGLPCCTEVGIP